MLLLFFDISVYEFFLEHFVIVVKLDASSIIIIIIIVCVRLNQVEILAEPLDI